MRIDLDPSIAPTVEALLAGAPLGDIASADAQGASRRLLQLDLATPRPSGRRAGSLRVAAVVPAHDAAATLPAALRGLTGVQEVIVVDDGSADDTARVAADLGATVLRRPVAGGPAAARNAGAAQTDADVVVFVDADTEAPPGWIGRLLPHFDDPLAGGVAPRVVPVTADSAPTSDDGGTLDLGAAPGLVRPDGRITFVSTTALAVRRKAFLDIGGFSEDLRFGEDLDLVWRMWDAGHPVVYEPSVEVGHRDRPDLRAHLVNQFRYATASGPLSARHAGVPRAGRADPLVALGAVTFLLGARRTGAALALGGTARIGRSLIDVRVPTAESALTAVRATLDGARNVAAGVSRPWLPVSLTIAAASPRARPGLVAAIAARWYLLSRHVTPGSRRAKWVALRALEDTAHSIGVGRGCVSARRLSPLLPGSPPAPERVTSILGSELRLP